MSVCEHRTWDSRDGAVTHCTTCGAPASMMIESLHTRIEALRSVVGPRLPAPGFFSRDALLKCLDREIAMRERVYPKRVAEGKMREKASQDEIAMMRAIRHTIEQVIS